MDSVLLIKLVLRCPTRSNIILFLDSIRTRRLALTSAADVLRGLVMRSLTHGRYRLPKHSIRSKEVKVLRLLGLADVRRVLTDLWHRADTTSVKLEDEIPDFDLHSMLQTAADVLLSLCSRHICKICAL